MANSSTVQSGIQSMVQDNIGDEVVSVLFPRQVILYLMMRKNGDKQGVRGFGRPMVDGLPNTGIVVAGKSIPTPRDEEIFGAYEYKPPIMYQEIISYGGEITAIHDSDPAVENWEDNQIESTIIRPSYRWSVDSEPIEISLMNLRMMKRAIAGKERAAANRAVGDLVTWHTKNALAAQTRRMQSRMVGSATPSTTTDAPASVTSTLWSRQYSIPSIIGSTSNNYAGIDRSLSNNKWFWPLVNTTSQALNLRDMINWARNTAPVYGASGAVIGTGMDTFGLGLDAFIVGPDLWPSVMAQADALKGQVFHEGGFPDFPIIGYKQQCVLIDGIAIVKEPTWPAGTVAGLALDTWFFAIHPDANFTATEPERQNKIAGGHRSVAYTSETQYMYGCVFPAANAYWTTVT